MKIGDTAKRLVPVRIINQSIFKNLEASLPKVADCPGKNAPCEESPLPGVGCSPSTLLDFVDMLQSYDYISLFVPLFDVSVSFGSLFQRILSIYN